MTDQAPKQGRKLRVATQTMRERAEQSTAKDAKKATVKPRRFGKMRSGFQKIGRLPIWKPFKFVGKILVPPYIRSSWRELRQVTWPDRKQTRVLTSAVIMFSIVFGLIVAGFDYGLDKLFKQVILK